MAKATRASQGLGTNDRLDAMLKPGADSVTVLRGFVGRSERDGHIRLYASLSDTSVSADIAEADIVGSADVLDNALGKRVVWVKKGARITVTKSRTTEIGNGPMLTGGELVPVRAGRLTMQLKSAQRDTCISVCSCSTCQSHCTNWCGVCMCVPQVKAE